MWRLSEFQKADLTITTTKHKQRAVASPHVTKFVELPDTGLSFPLKADYERVNQALFDQSVVNNDDDALTMAHPFDGPGKGLSTLTNSWPLTSAAIPPPTGDEDAPIPSLEPEAAIEPPPVDQDEIDKAFNRQTFDHVRTGMPGDSTIYVNDGGFKVKLDRRGHQYGCDLEGVRNTMKSSRPSDIEPEVWKIMGPYRARLGKKAEKAAEAAPQPQPAPVAGSLIKIEVLPTRGTPPNAGGASSSSAACHLEKAMPALDRQSSKSSDSDDDFHPSKCTCVHCIISREGDSEDDIAPVVYNQYGSVYDASIPGQIAQDSPPLVIDEYPSIYDENKWAV